MKHRLIAYLEIIFSNNKSIEEKKNTHFGYRRIEKGRVAAAAAAAVDHMNYSHEMNTFFTSQYTAINDYNYHNQNLHKIQIK